MLRRGIGLLVLFAFTRAGAEEEGVARIQALRGALSQLAPVQVRKTVKTSEWVWVQVAFGDEPTPLVIDFVASLKKKPTRFIYMLPGGGLNFESDFFTPKQANLAQFLRREDQALVIGITPREDSAAPGSDLSIMAGWGLAKHRQDVSRVIEVIDLVAHMQFDVLGHSGGGLVALDYAAHASLSRFRRTLVLEMIGPYNPTSEATLVAQAQATSNAYSTLLGGGLFASDTIASIKQLVAGAALFPNADSGVPRALFGGPAGNFTLEGLEFFSFINTSFLPGATTSLTGLPESWYYNPGFFAGTYTFQSDPTQDGHVLNQSPLGVIQAALAALGSGLVPTALLRDTLAVFAGSTVYSIPWQSIDSPVVWVNAAGGLGNHPRGAQLIEQGGNHRVSFRVVPGYGHADVVFGAHASQDIWHFFD